MKWWLAAVPSSVGLAYVLGLLGFPSPMLFASLAVGLALSLSGRAANLEVPEPAAQTAFAVIGLLSGQLLSVDVLKAIAADSLAVAAAIVATLGLSVAGGYGLAGKTRLDRPTSVFGLIAGLSAGVVAVSRDAGADTGVVAVVQYLRVLLVLATIPVVTGLLTSGTTTDLGATPAVGPPSPWWQSLLFCLVVGGIGVPMARLVRAPSAPLLGPMVLAGMVAIAMPGTVRAVPPLLVEVAFLVMGLQVGLGFSLPQVRLIARSLPAIVAAIAGVMLGCAGLAAGMAWWTGRPLFDCYLATTPGGLPAVLGVAAQSDVDAGFVSSVQVVRVFVILLAAPMLGWAIRRRRPGPGQAQPEAA